LQAELIKPTLVFHRFLVLHINHFVIVGHSILFMWRNFS
jgi:hypothetical protein